MKKEFKSLSEEREDLLKYLIEQFGEKSLIPQHILGIVIKQDKEAVKRLKEIEFIDKFVKPNKDGDFIFNVLAYGEAVDVIFGPKLT